MTSASMPLFEAPPAAPPRPPQPARHIYTVSELTNKVRSLLETNYAHVSVDGELSNARVWKTGHLYFTLKDAAAQLSGVMYRSRLRQLPFTPENGMRVVASGRISVYAPKGEYQLVCERMEPQGVGARQLAFEQLRVRLEREGLFAANRKQPLPALPRKIGIVTSFDGAALRDVLTILRRRHPGAHIVISPTRVQGEGAAGQIERALYQLGRVPAIDVMIVARGGGSMEDLWAFNEETVARAIAAARVPVISAVGHETDFTISDFVADLRAPTPSAAAELVVARKDEMSGRIERAVERLRAATAAGVQRRRNLVHRLERRPGMAGWHARLAGQARHAAELTLRLREAGRNRIAVRRRHAQELHLRLEAAGVGRRLERMRARLAQANNSLRRGADNVHARCSRRLGTATARLDALSPLAVLGRGFAVCWNADRSAVIRTAADVAPGDAVRVTLHRGELVCEVTETK